MKASRDVRKQAKSLLRACVVDGRLDEARVRKAAEAVAQKKPRNAEKILKWFKNLVTLEIGKRTVEVESAVELSDQGKSIFEQAEAKFGPALARRYQANAELLGGLRIRIGSNVWDGSILQRLKALKSSKN